MIATCFRSTPFAINLPAWAHCSGVNFGRLPPIRPFSRAAANPARVRSTINSLSISARADMIWKMKRPIGLDVSMLSVRLLKWMPRWRSSSTSSTKLRMLRPRRSSFQTTSVSPSFRVLRSFLSAGRFATVPLIFSSKICSHPARSSACRMPTKLMREGFFSGVTTLIHGAHGRR